MKNNKKSLINFLLSLISFVIFSCSFLLMPFGTDSATGKTNSVTYISGAIFWIFLIIGIITQIMLSKTLNFKNKKKSIGKRIGVVAFFSNKYAIIADIVLIIGALGFAISIIFAESSDLVCYVFAFVLMLSFCMHCIFNGKKFALLIKEQRKMQNQNVEKENS